MMMQEKRLGRKSILGLACTPPANTRINGYSGVLRNPKFLIPFIKFGGAIIIRRL